MADTTIKEMEDVEIYFDTRTTEQWSAVTKNVPKGFMCVELTTNGQCRLKVGNGAAPYSELPYAGVGIDAAEVKSIAAEAIKEAFDEQGSLFRYKGRVDTTDSLPVEENKIGDVWLVGEENAKEFAEYYWTGTFFDYMGKKENVDLSEYYKKDDIDALFDGVNDKLTAFGEKCVKSTDKLILTCTMN